jgi:hypothetical protein
MDLQSFAKATVAGVPLVLVIVGLVVWFKSFKRKDGNRLFSGNALLVISMLVGLLLGGGWMITQTRPPAGDWYLVYVYWFAVLVYGLAMGIVASGLYEVARSFVEKTFSQLFADLITMAGRKA